MKYAWIAEQGLRCPLMNMCKVLDVSISGYRAWKRGGRPNRKRLIDAQMLVLIRAIHAEIRGAYGSPRMVRELRARGFPASQERIERLIQPETATLNLGLPITDSVPGELAQGATAGKIGSMKSTLWQTK